MLTLSDLNTKLVTRSHAYRIEGLFKISIRTGDLLSDIIKVQAALLKLLKGE